MTIIMKAPNPYGSLEDPDDLEDDKPQTGSSSMTSEASDLDDPDLRCGYGKWKPACLQKFNNSKALLAIICVFVFIQSFVINGIVNVNVSSLERRFHLSGKQVAWIASSYELTAAVLSFIVGYLATFAHKPRLIAIAAGVMSVGSFIMVLPHVIVEPYSLGASIMDVCDLSGNSTDYCEHEVSGLSNYVFVFITGQIIHGLAAVTVYTVGTPIIDESTDARNSPMYIGILHGISALGPAVGFLFGGGMLHFYVDYDKVDMSTIDVTPSDPRWVGAWWIGFAVASGLAIPIAFIMACFGRELPDTAKHRMARVSEAHGGIGEEETRAADFGKSFPDFLTSIRIVCCNPTWVFMTIGATMEAGLVQAIITFLPQALQFQFALTSGTAALLAGAVVVPAAALGQVLGGLIPKWLNLKTRGMIIQCIIGCGVTLLLSFSLLLHCDNQTIAGVTVQYMNSSLPATGMEHPCNVACGCHERSYEPVCGSDGIQYFSPCHAGCIGVHGHAEDMVYYNCSCVPAVSLVASSVDDMTHVATEGSCPEDCNVIYIFMPFLFAICIGTFIANTAFVSLTMRIVPLKQRAFATGLQGTIIRFLGATPFPLIFGVLIDQVCLVWQESCYEEKGSCWVYDSTSFGVRIMYMAIIAKSISTGSLGIALFVYKPPKGSEYVTMDDKAKSDPVLDQMDTRSLDINGDGAATLDPDNEGSLVINDSAESSPRNNNYSTMQTDLEKDSNSPE